MSKFVEIHPNLLNKNPFQLIGTDWMLITAEKDNRVNTMVGSWGGFGVLWGKNVAFIVIRPERYTKQFVDGSDTFSLTFFDDTFKKQLEYLGTVSGRDEDKISKSKLTVQHSDGTPYFEEAKLVILCRKLYAQAFKPECFIASELNQLIYPKNDHHTLYVAEIERMLIKD